MKRVAVFASGSGNNAENIVRYFMDKPNIEVSIILTNNPNAFVLDRAKRLNIPSLVFNRADFSKTDKIVDVLIEKKIDLIVLAGFLLLLPPRLIDAFPNKIVNIHPALLPKFGGKGMYGMNVHNAVLENKEKESGITIHMVNEKFDDGKIVFQAKCVVEESDTAEDVAEKIHKLEYEHFPKIVEQLL